MMEKLVNMVTLDDKFEQITATELRTSSGEILTQISMGKTFIITKRGSPIAVITKPEPNAFELGSAIRKAELLGNPPTPEKSSSDIKQEDGDELHINGQHERSEG